MDKLILLVDDESWYTFPVIEMLEHMNFKVVYKMTVEDGLTAVEENDFSIIIIDMILPLGDINVESSMPGIYLFKQLKAKVLQVPIICHTVVSESEIRFHLGDSQDYHHITKCDNSETELFKLVKQLS